MLLPSGPANTRCSVWRFDPGNLHVQLSPAPGTGLQSPETGSQNRRYRDLDRRQRPHVPHLNLRKCPQIAGYLSETRKHRFASDCVVGPGGLEPQTTSLRPAVQMRSSSSRLQRPRRPPQGREVETDRPTSVRRPRPTEALTAPSGLASRRLLSRTI